MNKPVYEALTFSFYVFLTLAALAYTFWSMIDWPKAFEEVPTAETVFIEQTKIPEKVTRTGDQVVTKLYRLSQEGVPIEVDGQLYRTDLDVKKFQSRVLLNAKYEEQHVIDADGTISKVIFKKI